MSGLIPARPNIGDLSNELVDMSDSISTSEVAQPSDLSRTRSTRLRPADFLEQTQIGLGAADVISAVAVVSIVRTTMGHGAGFNGAMAMSLIPALALCVALGQTLGTYGLYLLLYRRAQILRSMVTCAVIAGATVALTREGNLADGFDLGDLNALAAFSIALGCGLLVSVGARIVAWSVFSFRAKAGQLVRRVAVVTPDGSADELPDQLARPGQLFRVEVAGVFKAIASPGITNERDIDALAALARKGYIDEIVLAGVWKDPQLLREVADHFSCVPVAVGLCPQVPAPYRIRPVLLMSGDLPALTVFTRPLSTWQSRVKRVEDIVLTVPLLLFTLPLIVLCAILVKLDSPGPCLYRQKRYGFNREPITIYKFRTMHDGCGSAFAQATRHDPRVTRVGGLLRRLSLDELPQLFNVLEGSMSLVGPRPHPIPLDDASAPVVSHYFVRHRVKPGITGWAQINGYRGETDKPEKMIKRVEFDICYVEHWSVLFDLKILVRTALLGFIHPNAY